MTIGSVLESFFQCKRDVAGFRGVDTGPFRGKRAPSKEPILRLHLTRKEFARNGYSATRNRAENFQGIPVQVVVGDYAAVPRTADGPKGSHFLTSGLPCAGRGGGGQIALVVVDRATGQPMLLSAWAAVAVKHAHPGARVFERPNPPQGERPIGRIASTILGRFGSVALFEPVAERSWLPIVRPGNQTITALKMPMLGEELRVGQSDGVVEGKGIYRIRHEVGPGVFKSFDTEAALLRSSGRVAAGALAYHEPTSTAAAMVTAFDQANDQTVSIACKLPRVMADLGLRLAEFDDLLAPSKQLPPQHHAISTGSGLDDPRESADSLLKTAVNLDRLKANQRADIATVIWPALRDAITADCGQTPRITDRIELLDPLGGYARSLARAINASYEFGYLGLPRVESNAFHGLATFDQVCERLNDLIEARAS